MNAENRSKNTKESEYPKKHLNFLVWLLVVAIWFAYCISIGAWWIALFVILTSTAIIFGSHDDRYWGGRG